MIDPDQFIISRKRKKYRFALFANCENCYELEEWIVRDDGQYILEVGAGTALFLVELAACNPDQNYIAVDVKADRLQKGATMALERGLKNISFVRTRADQLLQVCAPATVAQVWLTFSDPFPKKRSAKQRLTHARFLAIYEQLLAPGGVLAQKTDNHDLFDWSLEQLVTYGWVLNELSYDLHASTLNDDYKLLTTFEKKFIGLGQPIYFVSSHR